MPISPPPATPTRRAQLGWRGELLLVRLPTATVLLLWLWLVHLFTNQGSHNSRSGKQRQGIFNWRAISKNVRLNATKAVFEQSRFWPNWRVAFVHLTYQRLMPA